MTLTDDKPMTVDALMALATEYAHCYAFVGDDTMPRRKAELRAAIEQYGKEQYARGINDAWPVGRGRDEPVAYRVLAYGRTQKITVRLDVADEWASNCRNNGAVDVEVQPLYTASQPREPVAHMFPSDLERFAKEETKAFAFSVAVSCTDETSVPLFLGSQQQPGEPLTDEQIARLFHDAYKRLASTFLYCDSRTLDPESPNDKLMIAVLREVAHNIRSAG